jgi:5-methylcytosine-specific restriction protein A
MAEVFGYVADHGDTVVLPAVGGRRPHVNVLIRLEDLENRARAACLDFAGVATPSVLRRLCCDACVIPIVMDGAGQPLDVGRMTRTIPDGLRRAVAARDRGCAHPGCDRLPSWCEVHHVREWEWGGETRLDNLVMLCLVHHREIHTSGWVVRIAADGLPEFYPPAWIDPLQRPRRRPRPVPDCGPSDSAPPVTEHRSPLSRIRCAIPSPPGRAGRIRTSADLGLQPRA